MTWLFRVFPLLCATWLLSSCGMGALSGNGQIQALTGAPMSNAKVSIQSLVDGSTTTSTADDDGLVNMPRTGVTYPALVRATSASGGLSYFGYIKSSSQSQVPVNPISTLILTLAAGGHPSAITSPLSDSALQQAKSKLSQIFANVFSQFGVNPNLDFLANNIAADHTGIDLILDSISISVGATGDPLICSKVNAACASLSLASLSTTAFPFSAQDYQSLSQVPVAACSNLLHGLSTNAVTGDAALYDSGFLHSGLNAAGFMAQFAQQYSGLNVKFRQPTYQGRDGNGNFIFSFLILDSQGNYLSSMSLPVKLDTGARCVAVGNQLPFNISLTSLVLNQVRVDGTSNANATTNGPQAGLYFAAGGNGTTVRDVYQGTQIQSLVFDYCDGATPTPVCVPLVTLYKAGNNDGFYFSGGQIPLLSYTTAGLTRASFYNGNPNPVRVRLRDASDNTVGSPLYLRVQGAFISDTEVASLNLPAISNASALLNSASATSDPMISYTVNDPFVVSGVSLAHGAYTGQVASTTQMILSGRSGSASIAGATITPATDSYRSLTLRASVAGTNTQVQLKYVWSTGCPGCI